MALGRAAARLESSSRHSILNRDQASSSKVGFLGKIMAIRHVTNELETVPKPFLMCSS